MKSYVLITGASSGIGKSFAEYYARQGCSLVVVARSKNKLDKFKILMENTYGIEIVVIPQDLSIPGAAQKVFDLTKELNINVDTLVNAAGFGLNGLVHDIAYNEQHNQIVVNVLSLFDLTKLFLSTMKENNQGTIINIASSSAYHPIPSMAVYAASKAFVLSFTEALAIETKDNHIQVIAMSPGATDTNFFSAGKGVAYGQLRTPEHVVEETIKALRKGKISKIDGANNYFTSTFLPRMLPRKAMAKMVYNIMKKTR
ncbi:SDR family NAD(P)-dependent oxidoreductase [Lactobacillus xylocopicola]|uniref:Short-chain dehydrogenase n=1 Tax=Lactobacillus xylocopicola TaxID=2976676 RepID=A0ABM8BH42_9LACO|nr:SDR family oxidoreductase [Lactobacillus xylocopicola]BDR60606.1 short-chain dehydrogenase [Lactobacillus xylocopicola]